MRLTRNHIIGAVAVAFFILLTMLAWSRYRDRQARYDRDVSQGNTRAANDTSKLITTKDTTALVVQRLIEQANIRERELQGALGQAMRQLNSTARSLNEVRIELKRVNQTLESGSAVSVDTIGTRKYDFTMRGPPIEGSLSVLVPRDSTKTGTLNANLGVTPFNIKASLTCDRNKDASFLVETPPWVNATIEKGTVEPDVCRGRRPKLFGDFFPSPKKSILYGGVIVGSVFVVKNILLDK